MALRIYNTFSKQIEEFQPQEPGRVSMYNCGPTVYSDPHIGNFRSFLMADLLRRYFERRGFAVDQIMNITDVGHLTEDDVADAAGEDKLEKQARVRNLDPWQIARQYEEVFFANLDALNMRRAHHYPRATEHIDEMIEMIEALVAADHAYLVEGVGVYFRVRSFESYGTLSGRSVDDQLAGARVTVDDRKESPEDFALWKIDDKHLMQWDSPWGRGFPGWHIECSAMSRKYLGDTFDIHTGGEDNIFPHHECERAQSLCATTGEFSRYWVHARFLLVDGTKMSKSKGNFFTINDLLERGYTGAEIRYSLISSHFRQQANFTVKGLEDARKALGRLQLCRERMQDAVAAGQPGPLAEERTSALAESLERVDACFDDELNISGVLGEVSKMVRGLPAEPENAASAQAVLDYLAAIDSVLGVIFSERYRGGGGGDLSAEQHEWIREREEARGARDFARADELRDRLAAAGIEITDLADGGTEWRRASG